MQAPIKVIITGATGMVGEGVLIECLENSNVSQVLSISRKPCGIQHARLKELLIPDFTKLSGSDNDITGYDACFYCAGISSVGVNEEKYTYITYDTTIAFASALLQANPNISFCYVTGRGTDSTEKGKSMWARVKGRTENTLMKMPFRGEYNFRPAGMLAFPQQKKSKAIYKYIVKAIGLFAPSSVLTLSEVGKAMINAVLHGAPKQVLEIKDIKALVK